MIRGFAPPQLLEPENPGHLQWGAALKAGLIAGAILLIVPRASPWSSITSFDPAIMGRPLAVGFRSWLPVWLTHLLLSVAYGLCISRLVVSLRGFHAVLAGGFIGLILYGLNLLIVSLIWPQMRGNELSVVFTHVVFGLIAAAAYRGLLKRKPAAPTTAS
jgi:hypothetical protein